MSVSADAVVKSLIEATNLSVVVAWVPGVAREASTRHQLQPVSAVLLGQTFAAAAVLAGLQKGDSRVNLQLECDGALRGLFVDAGADGTMRGYVKNTLVDVELGSAFRWRAALGNRGFLSVLRDIGHEYYRSSIELEAFELGPDLNRFFTISEQVQTRVAVSSAPVGADPLGRLAAVLVQALPDGDVAALERVGERLQRRLDEALQLDTIGSAEALLSHLFPGQTSTQQVTARFACTCSRERTLDLLSSLGKAEVQEIVDTAGSTAITCHFCATKYEISLPDLLGVLERLTRDEVKN